MNAKQLIASLKLEPLAGEGGFFKRVYESNDKHADNRRHGASILYLLEAPDFSCFHRIDCDELWYFHSGAALRIWQIDAMGELKNTLLGDPSVHPGAIPHLCVKKGLWFASEVAEATGYSLVSCCTIPEFLYGTFELAKRESLCEEYPQHAEVIARLTR